MKAELDLTTGSIPKKLLHFAVPLLMANLLQAFYSIVDLMVVGRFVGETGLAAVSNASSVSYILNSLGIGFSMGGTVLIAQHQGANDGRAQAETAGTLLTASLLAALAVTCLGLFTYRPLFGLLRVPATALDDARAYTVIICLGTSFSFGYNAVCAILKGCGDAKSPLYFILIATAVNVALDLVLVGPCRLGTRGAAIATVAAQGCSFLVAAIRLRRHRIGAGLDRRSFALKGTVLRSILKIGLPTAAQMAVVNLSYLVLAGMLNPFGVAVAAAAGVGLKINTLAGMPCWAIGQAVTAMTGQNFGAGDMDRVRRTAKTALLLNVAVTAAVAVCIQCFAEPLILLFDPSGAQVAGEGVLYLRICCSWGSLFYAAMYTLDSFAIGVGAAKIAMCNALLDAAIVRLPVSWILAFTLGIGPAGIYFGQALSPVIPMAAGLVYFIKGTWRRGEI